MYLNTAQLWTEAIEGYILRHAGSNHEMLSYPALDIPRFSRCCLHCITYNKKEHCGRALRLLRKDGWNKI